MKIKLFTAAAAAAVFAIAGSAAASITITSENATTGNTALGDGVANGALLADGMKMIDNFGDGGGAQTPIAGFTFNPQVFDQGGGVAGYIRNGAGPPQLLSGESAPPPIYPGVNNYETGNYYTVTSDGGPHTATLTVTSGWLSNFSFYLGSPDTYNTVQFFVGHTQLGPTLAGNQIWSCTACAQNGDQSFGARAVYDFGGAHVTSVVFGSTGNSFEFDNLAGTLAVPEPASWALMIMGFGAAGAMLRSKRRQTA
ncbi:MAG: Npun_F0296 family exosortase-dependent surface protein, partial [Phenylobacterium sp.]